MVTQNDVLLERKEPSDALHTHQSLSPAQPSGWHSGDLSGRVSGQGTESCAGSSLSHSSCPCGCVVHPRHSHRVPSMSWTASWALCVPLALLTSEKRFRSFLRPIWRQPWKSLLCSPSTPSGEVGAAWQVKTARAPRSARGCLPPKATADGACGVARDVPSLSRLLV